MSIRLRLTLWVTVLLLVVVGALSFVLYSAIARQTEERFDENLRERALDIQRDVSGFSPGERGRGAQECISKDASPTPITLSNESLYVEVYDKCGNVSARSTNLTGPLLKNSDRSKNYSGKSVFLTGEVNGDEVRIYTLGSGNDRDKGSALLAATSTSRLASDLLRLKLLLISIVAGTTLLCAMIGWFLAAKAMLPVDRITRAAHDIGVEGDVSGRVPEPRENDEIGRLARTFNEMLGRIQQSFETQRLFLADASHELRTPLTAIRANVETLRRNKEIDPAERDETLRIVEREVDRMGRLVDDLLSLARADAGQAPQMSDVALDALLLEVYHQQRALAGKVRLSLGAFQPVQITGDRDQLKQLLLNLLDNALRHTPAGGSVTVDLLHEDHVVMIRVRDTGAGIAPEHLPHIFERFYRADPTRTRATGGTGLGLAISQEIAAAHGGRIEVASILGEGSTFTVFLPTQTEPGPVIEADPDE